MGFMDKFKETSQQLISNATENASTAMEQKAAEREMQKQIKADDQARQEQLKAVFTPTNNMGDIAIDSNHNLFKVKRASSKLPKKSGIMGKTAKATAAMMTLGASVAVEMAMKPSDRIFEFTEIRSFELLQDDSQVVGGGVGMALVGGAFFGGIGMIAGSMVGGKKTKKTIDNLILQINLNDINMPCILVPYINKTTKVTSNEYKKALSEARETISCLEMILERIQAPQQPSEEGVIEEIEVVSNDNDPYAELKHLKELLDMGIISQEEFDAKKQQLLDL